MMLLRIPSAVDPNTLRSDGEKLQQVSRGEHRKHPIESPLVSTRFHELLVHPTRFKCTVILQGRLHVGVEGRSNNEADGGVGIGRVA